MIYKVAGREGYKVRLYEKRSGPDLVKKLKDVPILMDVRDTEPMMVKEEGTLPFKPHPRFEHLFRG